MNTLRWLLPFTHGVDMLAIDQVLRLAKGSEATLVAASLVAVPDKSRSRGARLEHIQQSKDFLEAVKWKAARLQVPVERNEIFTVDAMQSLAAITHELDCGRIILVSRGGQGLLLDAHEMKRLLLEPPVSLVVLRLTAQKAGSSVRHPVVRFLSRLRQYLGQQDESFPVEDVLAIESPLWVRTEERNLS
jgi:hypothetical protein